MVEQLLNVEYHQQNTYYYCGSASAQMVLNQIGAVLIDQDILFQDHYDNSTPQTERDLWYSAPDGIQGTLNNLRPASAKQFDLFGLGSEDAISRRIVWTIQQNGVAPVALRVNDQSLHWIVVSGYQASNAPSDASDTAYSIEGFFLNDPWPPVADAFPPPPPPPLPHVGGDGCTTGAIGGHPAHHISYAEWQTAYMHCVPNGYWAGQYIAICDGDPEPPAEPTGVVPPPTHPGGQLKLTPDEIKLRAVQGLEYYGLVQKEPWATGLKGASPAAPILVERLDQPNRFYYIVPMMKGGEKLSVPVSVDAGSGKYGESVCLSDRSPLAIRGYDPSVIRETITKRIEVGELGVFKIAGEAHQLYPTPVWKPCRESQSPFYPFHVFALGSHRIYVRVDGKVFTHLHDRDRG